MTDPPAELVALRKAVWSSVCLRFKGKPITLHAWLQMTPAAQGECKESPDMRLVQQLREAEQEWSTALWEQKEATR